MSNKSPDRPPNDKSTYYFPSPFGPAFRLERIDAPNYEEVRKRALVKFLARERTLRQQSPQKHYRQIGNTAIDTSPTFEV